MYFLLNLSHCVKSYGHLRKILALFMMPTHQIWSCHLTQGANFEKFLFCPNFIFNIGKSHKISIGKTLPFRSYQPKTSQGGRTPRALGLRSFSPNFFKSRDAKTCNLAFWMIISIKTDNLLLKDV